MLLPLHFSFRRTTQSFWGQWIWTSDLVLFFLILTLMGLGTLLIMAASPSVALNYGKPPLYFFYRHLCFLFLGILVLLVVSHLSPEDIRRTGLIVGIISIILLWFTLLLGTPIKGAKRWLNLGVFKLQASEIARPTLTILTAWLLHEGKRLQEIPGTFLACFCLICALLPIICQPDLGMSLLIVFVFFIQLFIAGLSWRFIGFSVMTASFLGLFSFAFFPHVRLRLITFFNPSSLNPFEERFQIIRSLKAFQHGGFWGKGPGEGIFKKALPDAHTDFILAVAGEEFGAFFCFSLLALYGFIAIRTFLRAIQTSSTFIQLALTGLASHLVFQVMINTASVLSMIPTKGMPLPFISYGGSSMIGSAFLAGSILALTRKRLN